MATVLRLTVLTGPHRGDRFCFNGSVQCLVGRAGDCFVRLAGTCRDACISRHHCELIVEPTLLTMKDLQSQNGTYFNGARVASQTLALASNRDDSTPNPISSLHQGDLLTIGGTTLKLDLVECASEATSLADEPAWREGETAKKGCPIQCV